MSASSLSVSAGCRGGQSLEALLNISASQLCHADIAEMNLLCATGLPGAENLGVGRCLATLDAWAGRVRRETDRHLYRFRQAPAEFNHSEGYFRMMMLVTVLQQDFGVRYNPDRIRGIDFRDSRDLFIHGLLDEPHSGTCASMPVLYVAAGRRLGYPLKLVLTHGHIFARWEGADGRDRFNVECASRGMLSFPDGYYKTWPTPLTDEQVRKGRYLLSLGAAEELAVFMESRGHCLLDNGRTREARMAYEHACRLDPLSPGHWSWLEDARVREASRPPGGDNLKTFSNWGCSMAISCLPIANSTLSAEPVRTFPLDSTRYRNYHPTLGRWIERDPMAYHDGMNFLEYVTSSPAMRGDWTGAYVSKEEWERIKREKGPLKPEEPAQGPILGSHGFILPWGGEGDMPRSEWWNQLTAMLNQLCPCFEYRGISNIKTREGYITLSPHPNYPFESDGRTPSSALCCCYYEHLAGCNVLLMYARRKKGVKDFPIVHGDVNMWEQGPVRSANEINPVRIISNGQAPGFGHELVHGIYGLGEGDFTPATYAAEELFGGPSFTDRYQKLAKPQLENVKTVLRDLVTDQLGCSEKPGFGSSDAERAAKAQFNATRKRAEDMLRSVS